MKHLRIKTKLFQRAALTLLLAVAGITNASAEANWVGNSAIYLNGTWYYCGHEYDWCGGGKFDGKSLGILANTIQLAGQSCTYEDGKDWNGGSMTMGYRIDNGQDQSATLDYYKFEGNNNCFQLGGSNFTHVDVDISNLSPGLHTISVWFNCDNQWDSNNSKNYVATFTVSGSINVVATQAPDNNYWATFYCGNANYAIDSNENACAYTATVSGSNITLHKLGKVIPQKTAVIIVGEDNSIGMSTSNASVEYDVSNDLHGLDLAKPASTVITDYQGATTIYMLSDKNNNFGFHNLYSSTTVPASKAFLALDDNDGAHSRGFTIEFEDDGTTGIRTIGQKITVDDNWYSLDGRRLNGKPTAKGVYINNGKKIILK